MLLSVVVCFLGLVGLVVVFGLLSGDLGCFVVFDCGLSLWICSGWQFCFWVCGSCDWFWLFVDFRFWGFLISGFVFAGGLFVCDLV